MVGEEVVERHAAVHRGPDHRPPVRALEVPLHDLVQLKIFYKDTENIFAELSPCRHTAPWT